MTSTASISSTPALRSGGGERLLDVSARTWWVVALIGQAAFLAYLLSFYAPATLTGNFEQWNRAPLLKGYAPGEHAWNLNFAAHVLLAAVVTFGGTLQMIPQIRERAIWFHRWNGRAFMATALLGAVTGLWMVWVGHVSVGGANPIGQNAISLDAVLIILFAAVAWGFARAGRIVEHRRWALRLFMVANGVWFLRLGLFSWGLLTGGAGMTDKLDGPMNYVFDFASYLVPLAVLELYLRARDARNAGAKTVAATVLFAASAYMCIGIVVLFMFHLPRIMG